MWTIKRLSIIDDMPILEKDGKPIMMIDEEHFDDFAQLLAKANAYDKFIKEGIVPGATEKSKID